MKAIVITIILLLAGIALIALPACDSGQGVTDSPPTTQPPEPSSTKLPPPPPPPELPGHWHPKLDSAVNQLIDAQEQGNTEMLDMAAELGYIVDGDMRVVLECELGQAEAAAEAAANLGAEILVISSDHDTVGAIVPISKLTTLADEDSIRSIRLPVPAVPAG
jgi:hypothetical protein